MKLYLYKTGTSVPELTIENAASYTDREVVTAGGEVLGPLAEDMELSETADCTGTLRADWREANPSQERRIEELETLMAELLFGGEGV